MDALVVPLLNESKWQSLTLEPFNAESFSMEVFAEGPSARRTTNWNY